MRPQGWDELATTARDQRPSFPSLGGQLSRLQLMV